MTFRRISLQWQNRVIGLLFVQLIVSPLCGMGMKTGARHASGHSLFPNAGAQIKDLRIALPPALISSAGIASTPGDFRFFLALWLPLWSQKAVAVVLGLCLVHGEWCVAPFSFLLNSVSQKTKSPSVLNVFVIVEDTSSFVFYCVLRWLEILRQLSGAIIWVPGSL